MGRALRTWRMAPHFLGRKQPFVNVRFGSIADIACQVKCGPLQLRGDSGPWRVGGSYISGGNRFSTEGHRGVGALATAPTPAPPYDCCCAAVNTSEELTRRS